MEKSNNIKRSELWENIYGILSELRLKDSNGGDMMDIPSATTKVELAIIEHFKSNK